MKKAAPYSQQSSPSQGQNSTRRAKRQAVALKQGVASDIRGGYSESVVTLLATGFGDPSRQRRTGAHIIIAGAFFVPVMPCYGGRAWETERSAGFLCPRFANPRTAATPNRFATVCGRS